MIQTYLLKILSVPFGLPDKLDRTREYFDRETDLGDYDRAVYHNHQPDRLYGCIVDNHLLPNGVMSLAQITLLSGDEWLAEEIMAGRVYASAGTGDKNYVVDENGHITSWPFVEISLVTPYTELEGKRSLPANWKARVSIAESWKGVKIMPPSMVAEGEIV